MVALVTKSTGDGVPAKLSERANSRAVVAAETKAKAVAMWSQVLDNAEARRAAGKGDWLAVATKQFEEDPTTFLERMGEALRKITEAQPGAAANPLLSIGNMFLGAARDHAEHGADARVINGVQSGATTLQPIDNEW